MTKDEQETTISFSRALDYVDVWTSVPDHVARFSEDDRLTVLEMGQWDGGPYGRFRIPAELWDPIKGLKRKRTPAQQEQARVALQKAKSAPEIARSPGRF